MTVNRSSSTRTVRPMPYLLWPRVRGRWLTAHLREPHAHPRRHRRDEAVHLAVEAHAPHDLGPHGLQRAAVVVEAHAGGPRDQPVGEPGGDPLRERVLAALPPAADHVEVALLQPGHEPRDVGRVVLQVAVRGHDDVAAGVVEARREGRRLAEVAAQEERPHAGVAALEGQELLAACRRCCRRPRGRSRRGEPPAARRGGQLAVEVVDVLGLVEDGDDDGDLGAARSLASEPEYKRRPRTGRQRPAAIR